MGEKFSANPATGAGSLSIPIFTSRGRGRFGPSLALEYGSGNGNGVFGMGWSLSVPRITRKTSKGLPRYMDAAESDGFILSGAEDLVPGMVETNGQWASDQDTRTDTEGTYLVRRYRPRVEAAYARVERWTRTDTGDIHWRSTTKDNLQSIYGKSTAARIADPTNPSRVFSWLLEETADGKGNLISYQYRPEDQTGLNPDIGWDTPRPIANTYLASIWYGNTTPYVAGNWLFQVLFDYGDRDTAQPLTVLPSGWPSRMDPFSDFRATFEIRTYRLCQRVLMLHNFDATVGWNVVRSTEFQYNPDPVATTLQTAQQVGWQYVAANTPYTTEPLPPLSVSFSQATIASAVQTVDNQSLVNLPIGADGDQYRFTDLDGEGLPGILTRSGGALFYKRNRGDGKLGPLERLPLEPSILEPRSGTPNLVDLDGSGNVYAVQRDNQPRGYFERWGEQWGRFAPFRSLPNVDWQDSRLRFVDLDGDGLPDLLRPEGDLFRWWPSRGKAGYGNEVQVPQPRDERAAPYVVWTDPRQAIFFADMTGDGLSDVVRISAGSVSYWPNRGYGRFGARVIMRNAPTLAAVDQFNPKYIRLGDVDGSGTTDLIYLQPGAARIWLNQAGNGYGAETRVPFPSPAGATVDVVDFLGKGTGCLVWSSPQPAAQGTQLRYIDLVSGTKPYLLTQIDNNLGAKTTIEYAPSTSFYLADRAAGLPWITRLPFPVQVVSRLQIDEAVTVTRIVTQYRYHHGRYDGVEREFSGFGMVEVDDAETLQLGSSPPSFTPPRRTKSWFHNGAFFDAETVSSQYATEYSPDFGQLLPDSVLTPGLTPEAAREAARALRGQLLRQEVYGLDGNPYLQPHPYSILESNFAIRQIQPRLTNRYAVFDVVPREKLTATTERNPADPRIAHEFTVAVDSYGNVTDAVQIAYPRRQTTTGPRSQTLATETRRNYATVDDDDNYRVDLVRQSWTYELTGLPPLPASGLYSFAQAAGFFGNAQDIDFSATPSGAAERRLFEQTQYQYLGDAASATGVNEQIFALGLVETTSKLALTSALTQLVYPATLTPTAAMGAYVQDGNFWWATSGTTTYDTANFYLPQLFKDPFGTQYSVAFEPNYHLLPVSATTAVGATATTVTAQNDYRILAPYIITDVNGNRQQISFDPLGRVTNLWLMGTPTQNVGDNQSNPSTTFYYNTTQVPAYVQVTQREQHYLPSQTVSPTLVAFTYTDGLGREVLTKKQAQPDASGPRWVGSGRTIFDNKGNPVQKYEPYFSSTSAYESTINGVSDLLQYDPIGRVTQTNHPDGSYARVAYGELDASKTFNLNAWGQIHYDEGDTVEESGNGWYSSYSKGTLAQQNAAKKALAYNNTPARMHIDSLGRVYLTEADNNDTELYVTQTTLDIQGNTTIVTVGTGSKPIKIATTRYDLLRRPLQNWSADAGTTTTFPDVVGAPVVAWNANGAYLQYTYDLRHRPQKVFVTDAGAATARLVEWSFYGEDVPQLSSNLLGKLYAQLDGAGLSVHNTYDCKGNLLQSSRQLSASYDARLLDWSAVTNPLTANGIVVGAVVDSEVFTTTTVYDALNRVTQQTMPATSTGGTHTTSVTYNETSLLDTITLQLNGGTPQSMITGITYNEKLQRSQIGYGNKVQAAYTYDTNTFRLLTLTSKDGGGNLLQSLSYTYDPVGNVTQIADAAILPVFVGNSQVNPSTDYTYDAIYRLISAAGREHAGQSTPDQVFAPAWVPAPPDANDIQALRNYNENYAYDPLGNFQTMVHQIQQPKGTWQNLWTRTYTTDATSNKLTLTSLGSTSTPGTQYTYDAAGNMLAMTSNPASPTAASMSLAWDYRNHLVHTTNSNGDTYFTYDSAGQRVRKTLVNGNNIKERFYLGTYEIYRERSATSTGTTPSLERRTLQIADATRRVALVELLTIGDATDGPAQLLRYQLDNHLGSAILELDANANAFSYEEYHPYGTTAYRAGASLLKTNPKRYAYTSKERDEETGLFYHGARYYACWIARWTAPDPKGLSDGVNVYAYVRANPVGYRDIRGTDRVDDLRSHPSQPRDPSGQPISDKEIQQSATPENIASLRNTLIHEYEGYLHSVDKSEQEQYAQHKNEPFFVATHGIPTARFDDAGKLTARGSDELTAFKLSLSAYTSGVGNVQKVREYYFQYSRFTSGFRDQQFMLALGIASAIGNLAAKINLYTLAGRGGGGVAISPQGGDGKHVSVYHGSINDSTAIRSEGFSVDRGTAFVSRDLSVAQDAIGSNRYEVSQGLARDPGIIESRIPLGEFNATLGPNERPYSGFYGSDLQSTEIPLRTDEQIGLVNKYIVR